MLHTHTGEKQKGGSSVHISPDVWLKHKDQWFSLQVLEKHTRQLSTKTTETTRAYRSLSICLTASLSLLQGSQVSISENCTVHSTLGFISIQEAKVPKTVWLLIKRSGLLIKEPVFLKFLKLLNRISHTCLGSIHRSLQYTLRYTQ